MKLRFWIPTVNTLEFSIPCPPVAKARARTFVQRGKIISKTPAKTKGYEKAVKLCAQAAVSRSHWKLLGKAKYRVWLHFYVEHYAGDWDNLSKAVCDAMNEIVYPDDRYIDEAHAYVRKVSGLSDYKPRCDVIVEQWAEDEAA